MSYAAVIGAGSWGTTLAGLLAGKNLDVTLWALEQELAKKIEDTRENNLYLPGVKLPDNLKATSDFDKAVNGARFVINVVPTQYMRSVLAGAPKLLAKGAIIVSASKGIERETFKRPSEIIKEITGLESVVLSGPSFAKEVAAGAPTAVAVAGSSKKDLLLVQELMNTSFFRVYTNSDVTGVELGGALKNVIAIAAGISDGLGLGHNARAALITRGLAEMKRLGAAMGANEQTFSGLSGIGDLVLTCTANLSRNYSFGLKLASGMSATEIAGSSRSVAEGVETSRSAYGLAGKHGVELPITEQVYRVIFEGKSPREAVTLLMTRTLKGEFNAQ
ncbi:MAG: NAD(P)-dependent glycerol-3-phosphate dehydrogenase [Nitrospiraceae bacterium]|nr:NAD(P)-dependent glycerol-3-phosphate dehydrogenase [Nitrospiraceae bacterium]